MRALSLVVAVALPETRGRDDDGHTAREHSKEKAFLGDLCKIIKLNGCFRSLSIEGEAYIEVGELQQKKKASVLGV